MLKSAGVEGQVIEIGLETNSAQQPDAGKDKLDDRVGKQSAPRLGVDAADDQQLLGVTE